LKISASVMQAQASKTGQVQLPESLGFVNPETIPDFWEGCFPCLFPYGRGGPSCLRKRPFASDSGFDQHVLKMTDQRFAKNKLWIFSRYYFRMQKTVGRIAWNSDKYGKPPSQEMLATACQYANNKHDQTKKQAFDIVQDQLLNKIEFFGGSIRASHLSMKKEKNDLMARIDSPETDNPMFFTTHSSADSLWTELFSCILKRKMISCEELPFKDRHALLAQNPVLAARCYRARFHAVLKGIVRTKELPYGHVIDEWHRIEFQARGSPHVHSMWWAIIEDEDGNKISGTDLVELMKSEDQHDRLKAGRILDKYIQCHLPECPDKEVDEEILNHQDLVQTLRESLKGPEIGLFRLSQAGNDQQTTQEAEDHCILAESLKDVLGGSSSGRLVLNRRGEKRKDTLRPASLAKRRLKLVNHEDEDHAKQNVEENEIDNQDDAMQDVEENENDDHDEDDHVVEVKGERMDWDHADHPSLRKKPEYKDEKHESRDRRRLVLGCQMHPEKHHPTSCFKYCKSILKDQVCWYHFPWPLNSKTTPKEVTFEGARIAQFRVVMKRNNQWVNNYNWKVLKFFRGNIDIQCICNPHGIAQYAIGNYIAKSDRPDKTLLSQKIMMTLGAERNMILQSDNNRKNLWNAGMGLVQATQTSEQQVAWFLLGFPLVECTRQVLTVNTTHPSQKVRYRDLTSNMTDQHQEFDDEDEDVNLKCDLMIQTFMDLDTDANPEVKEMSCYDFMSKYSETQAKDPLGKNKDKKKKSKDHDQKCKQLKIMILTMMTIMDRKRKMRWLSKRLMNLKQ